MNSNDIVVKTTEGVDELKSRSRKLTQRLRTVLIMIDGSLSVGQLQQTAMTLGVPVEFLDDLKQQGLIAIHGSATQSAVTDGSAKTSELDRFRLAQNFMNDTVVDALGLRAFFFTLKVEKCYTLSELSNLLDDYEKAITKGSGSDVARVLVERARELLA